MIDDFPNGASRRSGSSCQTRGPRPDARTGCRSRRPRTTSRAASSPTSTARRRCRICGRAARPRAAACTARTGSRRTRCSTVSCSAAASSRRSSPARTMRRIDRRDGRCARSRPTRSRPTPIPWCCRRSTRPTRRAARRGATHDVRRLWRRARRRRVSSSRARRSPTSPARRRSPAAHIASYEVIDLLRVSRGDRRVGDRPRTESRGSHTRADFPDTVRRVARPLRRPRRRGAPVFVAACRRRGRGDRADDDVRSARAPVVRRVVEQRAGRGPRHPRRHHVDRVRRRRPDRGRGVRRPRRGRARRHRARDRDVSPGRRHVAVAVAPRTTATRSTPGTELGEVPGRCARSSPASASR